MWYDTNHPDSLDNPIYWYIYILIYKYPGSWGDLACISGPANPVQPNPNNLNNPDLSRDIHSYDNPDNP